VPEPEKPLIDERRRIGPNDVRITQNADGRWLVPTYPIGQTERSWPGSTFSSRDGTAAMLDWVRAQPWSRSTPQR
jgi:hypothetical protein